MGRSDLDEVPAELHKFIESLPSSVRGRVILLAQDLEQTGQRLKNTLMREARTLVLYDAIYREIDDTYDLANPMLSRMIRACIDNNGRVPAGTDLDVLMAECPDIPEAIEISHQRHCT